MNGVAAPLPRDARTRAPRFAPPDRVATPADGARIAAALQQLRSTESGRGVADFLATNRVDVRVLPDAVFAARHPGAGAMYDPRTKNISIPRSALASSALVTTLAHEGKHAQDAADRPHWMLQALGLIGGSAKDGAAALVTFRNPVTAWLDSLTARNNEDEVNAYRLQAQVAAELGRNESSWALGQGSDGTPLPLEEVRANVATNDLYRMGPVQRFVLSAGLGIGVTSFAAVGAQALAARMRPGSYLAAHSWPLLVLGGAVTSAWIGADQLRAHRLEEYSRSMPATPRL